MTQSGDIKRLANSKKLILGTERTLQAIRAGKAKQVFLSANCPQQVKQDIMRYQKITPFELVSLPYQNDELGSICKKPFAVSVLSVAL